MALNRKGFSFIGDVSPAPMADGLAKKPEMAPQTAIGGPMTSTGKPPSTDIKPMADPSGTSAGQFQGQISGGIGSKTGQQRYGPGGV